MFSSMACVDDDKVDTVLLSALSSPSLSSSLLNFSFLFSSLPFFPIFHILSSYFLLHLPLSPLQYRLGPGQRAASQQNTPTTLPPVSIPTAYLVCFIMQVRKADYLIISILKLLYLFLSFFLPIFLSILLSFLLSFLLSNWQSSSPIAFLSFFFLFTLMIHSQLCVSNNLLII